MLSTLLYSDAGVVVWACAAWVICFDAGAIGWACECACMGCYCALLLELVFGHVIACIGC